MRQVFCYKLKDNLWRIIDKSNGKVFEDINDVLLFNGTYKKYKGIKGWHGILSEEFNTTVKYIIGYKFHDLKFYTGTYYPRTNTPNPIKVIKASYIRLLNNEVKVCEAGSDLYHDELENCTKQYDKSDEDDYEEDEYEDE